MTLPLDDVITFTVKTPVEALQLPVLGYETYIAGSCLAFRLQQGTFYRHLFKNKTRGGHIAMRADRYRAVRHRVVRSYSKEFAVCLSGLVLVAGLAGCGSKSSPDPVDASPAPLDAPAPADAALEDAAPPAADATAPDATSPADADTVPADASVLPGDYPFVARLGSHDGTFLDQFGDAIALLDEGRFMAVGAPTRDQSSSHDGAVYLFRRHDDDWTFIDKLEAAPVEHGHFGAAIAGTNDVLVIGAPGLDSVHVYEQNVSGRWVEVAVLAPPEVGPQAFYFGHSVAVDEHTIAVGTFPQPSDEVPGAAYVFEKRGGAWVPTAALRGSDGHADDRFGHRVLLRGDRLLVSAYGHKEEGAVYEFRRGAGGDWQQVDMLVASDTDAPHEPTFGASLALQGDTLAVGAIYADGASPLSGAAYVFREREGAWQPVAKLVAPEGRRLDLFGMAVALADSYVFVGAIYSLSDAGSAPGGLFVFAEEGDGVWRHRETLFPRSAQSGSRFGMRLSASGRLLAVGSVEEQFNLVETGVVHVVDINGVSGGAAPALHR